MATCRLCLRDRRLVKSHVTPRAFYGAMIKADPSGVPIIVSNKRGAPTKRTPVGVYDMEILCADCEKRLGPWDNYAAVVLIHELDSAMRPLVHEGRALAFQRPSYDYAKLKLFFLSLLWRAAVSTMPYYQRIRLGPHEERVRQLIRDSNPSDPDDFGVFLERRVSSPHMETFTYSMILPFPEKRDGFNFVRVGLGPVIAHIKVDRRPMPYPWDEVHLKPGALLLLAQEFDVGNELRAMREIVRINGDRESTR